MDFPISVLPSRSFDAFRSTEPRTVEPTTATPLPPGSVTPIQNRPSLWRTPPSLCSGACPPAAAGCPSCSTAADIDPDIHYIPAHRRLLIAYVACEPLEVAINDGSPRVKKGASISSILSRYFLTKDPKTSSYEGNFTHSWYIGDPVFSLDLAMTLEGAIDREVIPTRERKEGELFLRSASRPEFQQGW